jgi:hypothetical protein
MPRKRRKLEKQSATRVDSTPEAATLKVASPKAALGDVHTGYAKVSSVRRWRVSVLSDGYPWWSLVAHAMDASIELIVLKHSLSLNLLSRISESQAVVDLSTNVNAVARREQAVQALLDSRSEIVMIDGDPPEAQSDFWKGADLKGLEARTIRGGTRACRRCLQRIFLGPLLDHNVRGSRESRSQLGPATGPEVGHETRSLWASRPTAKVGHSYRKRGCCDPSYGGFRGRLVPRPR